jgi:hypothetical protein
MPTGPRRDSFEEAMRLRFLWSLGALGASGFSVAFIYLFCNHPTAWAIMVGDGFVMASGLFVSCFLLGMRPGTRAVLAAVPIGSAVLGLLWLLYRSQR